MSKYIAFLCGLIYVMSGPVLAATSCSRANLTRCLDSVCAINISSNPAARCQYCGSASVGTPPAGGMRSVSVGMSTQYNISDKELKKAPSEPIARYNWAKKQCLAKVAGCTADDVEEVYEPLIEQSCTAAGVVAEIKSLAVAATTERTYDSCMADIRICVISDTNCGADFSQCRSDSDFDRVFATCGVEASGCDAHTSGIRDELVSLRDAAIGDAARVIESIVASYRVERENKLAKTRAGCADKSLRDSCVSSVCATNMVNRCVGEFAESEKAMATQLCKFYELACDTLD